VKLKNPFHNYKQREQPNKECENKEKVDKTKKAMKTHEAYQNN
jgi:hypothetical protein